MTSDIENNRIIARNIRRTLKNSGIKIGDAERAADVSPGYLSRIEKGTLKRAPSTEFILTVSNMTGVSTYALLFGTVNTNSQTDCHQNHLKAPESQENGCVERNSSENDGTLKAQNKAVCAESIITIPRDVKAQIISGVLVPSRSVSDCSERISVKDRLPDKMGYYLCYDGFCGGIYIYRFGMEGRVFNPDSRVEHNVNEYVTHWMPLPKPPKEETHGGLQERNRQ